MGEAVHFWIWRINFMNSRAQNIGRAPKTKLTMAEYFQRKLRDHHQRRGGSAGARVLDQEARARQRHVGDRLPVPADGARPWRSWMRQPDSERTRPSSITRTLSGFSTSSRYNVAPVPAGRSSHAHRYSMSARIIDGKAIAAKIQGRTEAARPAPAAAARGAAGPGRHPGRQ